MILQEIYSRLGIKVDRASLSAAQHHLKKLGQATEAVTSPLKKIASAGGLGKYIGAYAVVRGFQTATASALEFSETLNNLSVDSQGTVGNIDDLKTKILQVSDATGKSKEEVAALIGRFIELTGDGQQAVGMMDRLVKISIAARTSTEDTATMTASLMDHLKIAPDQIEKAFSVVSTAGKMGRIELKNFAGFFSTMGANFQQFANSQSIRGLTSVASGMQYVAKSFGSASEAATGMNQLMLGLLTREKQLNDIGIVTRNAAGEFREFSGVLFDMFESDKLQTTAEYTKVMGREASRLITFNALKKNREEWVKTAREIENADNISKDYHDRQNSANARFQKQMNRLRNEMQRALTPERIDLMINALKKGVSLMSFVLKHAEAILKVWLAIKAAQIAGAMAQRASALGVGAGGGIGPAVRGAGAMGMLAKGGALAGAGLAGVGIGMAADEAFGISDWMSGTGRHKRGVSDLVRHGGEMLHPDKVAALKALENTEQVTRYMVDPRTGKREAVKIDIGDINVSSPNANPAEVAKEMTRVLNDKLREAAASLGVQ